MMRIFKIKRLVQTVLACGIAILALSAWASAGQLAVLRNGFSIPHERRQVMGSVTRLYTGADDNSGYIDVPSSEIASFESEPDPPPPPSPPAATNVSDSVQYASSQTGIDPDLIKSVIKAESGFNPRAVSAKGAEGLMQLMPATASKLGVKDSFDPQSNVQAGSQYLRELLLRYHNNLALALAAYNAGPQRVAQYRGIPPYTETYNYVGRVIREFNRRKLAQRATQNSPKRNRAPVAAPRQASTSGGSSNPAESGQ